MFRTIALISLCFFVTRAELSYSQDAKKLFNKGFHYLSIDNFESINYLSQSIALDSCNAEAYYFRGIAHFKEDQLNEALSDFSKAESLDKKLELVPAYKGFTFRKLGQYDSAFQNFNRYIISHAADTSAYSLILRGKMRQKAGDIDGAIEDFGLAVNLDPLKESYHYHKFLAYFERGNFSNAMKEIDQAISLNSSFYGYYLFKGNIYYAQRQYSLAKAQYSIALDLNINNGDLYFKRGLAEKELKNFKEAILDFDTAIAYNEYDGTYFFHRGYAKLGLGDKNGACDDWSIAGNLGFYEDFDKIKEVCDQ